MYDIREYQQKKEEEKIKFIIDAIIDEINENLVNNTIYNTNFFLTGYNKQLDIILKKLEEQAKKNYINIETNVKKIPTSSFNLKIKAKKKDNLILKFIIAEKTFYNEIMENKIDSFNLKENKLNNLYILHALKTAYYHAGYDEMKIIVNKKATNIKTDNLIKKYLPKVIPLDILKYNKTIEEDRINNTTKKHK